MKTDFVFDMETGDPDDVLTLCVLATHPRVNLRAVTVFPGGRHQVGLVKHILRRLGKEGVLVGAGTPKKDVNHVSGFHYKWLGNIDPQDADERADTLLASTDFSKAVLVTGAPLTNIYRGYERWLFRGHHRSFFSGWICQGGFVGATLMPEHLVLEKFKGRETCPTWNLGGDAYAADAMLGPISDIPDRRLVPKSVCHGVFYTHETHALIPDGAHAGLDLLKEGMALYLKKSPEGKPLHDLIAAACAICLSIGEWVQVEPYQSRGEWGCKSPSTVRAGCPPIYALTELKMDAFVRVLSS